jgi:Tfp pilus assembly protein FimT
MASPKVFIPNPARAASKGFTVLEMLVVMGLFVLVCSLALIISMDSWRGDTFRNDRDGIVGALQRARSQAVNNMCLGVGCTDGKPHGVHFYAKTDANKDTIVIFQGNSFNIADANNESIKFASETNFVDSVLPVDIIFSQLSGNASSTVNIMMNGPGHSSKISVNSAGQIDWTN